MPTVKPITIVGGGLAGLTLGIGLRRRGIPATLWEAGRFPRHRVCGEFICGRGLGVLERLELKSQFEAAGAVRACTAMFAAGTARSPVRGLPIPALCLSRFRMDALLAGEFQRLGGELLENARWARDRWDEGVVRATGRRVQPTEQGWRWFGLKGHVAGSEHVCLDADLEMHVSRGGYVGLARINRGEVNVCGLFRSRRGAQPPESKQRLLRGEPGTLLHERLATATFRKDSLCSVAGLSLLPQRSASQSECRVGDALTMIPPVTGNGMSMAFESAEMAVDPLAAYSRGELDWAQARLAIARDCDAAFARRLAWARLAHMLMFSPVLRGQFGRLLLRSDWLWQLFFARTR